MDDDKPLQEENSTATSNERPWRPQDADKEYIKYTTRNRVRNATVPPQAVFKPAKPEPTMFDQENMRVAVYARVSTKSTEQVSSIENQRKYYTEKIDKNPNWTLQEIYSDEGKTGTSTKHRKEFRRMIADARLKKMDLIICASVSRFARNVSDLIEEVRKLKTTNPSHPIGVYFETEDIYTRSKGIDERLQMHAMFAEWESSNKSRRMILSYDQRICTGQYPVSDLLGYRHTIEGDLIIVEDEAKTVRFIYLAYISGYSLKQIAEMLTEKKRKTLRGRTEWNPEMVRNIMQNERRWGDLEARKYVVVDFKDRTTVRNDGIRDGAFIPHHHEGIVTPEIARAARLVSASNRTYMNSVPDLKVIDKGALRGFVVISPFWAGINGEIFISTSRGVYSDDEYDAMMSELVPMRNCTEVTESLFDGYEVPHGIKFLTVNSPALTLSRNGFQLNRICRDKLQNCEYVEFLYHPLLDVIAVRPCDGTSDNAVQWRDEEKALSASARAFSKAIYEKMDWVEANRFRFRGIAKMRDGMPILFFYADEPQILVGKERKQEVTGFSDSIPYTNAGATARIGLGNGHAYPLDLTRRIGKSFGVKSLRDRLTNKVTRSDILNPGTIVVNPLVGIIPTHEQVSKELTELYQSM